MATRILFFFFFKVLLLFLALSDSFSATSNGQGVGINYGQIANNLPSPARVAVLLRSLNITRVKLYDADPNVLSSFSNSQVDFMIGLGNEFLQNMSTDPTKAQSWIQQRLQPHITKTRITSIVVGNEIFKTNDRVLISSLLPAMKAVYSALTNLGLEKQVTEGGYDDYYSYYDRSDNEYEDEKLTPNEDWSILNCAKRQQVHHVASIIELIRSNHAYNVNCNAEFKQNFEELKVTCILPPIPHDPEDDVSMEDKHSDELESVKDISKKGYKFKADDWKNRSVDTLDTLDALIHMTIHMTENVETSQASASIKDDSENTKLNKIIELMMENAKSMKHRMSLLEAENMELRARVSELQGNQNVAPHTQTPVFSTNVTQQNEPERSYETPSNANEKINLSDEDATEPATVIIETQVCTPVLTQQVGTEATNESPVSPIAQQSIETQFYSIRALAMVTAGTYDSREPLTEIISATNKQVGTEATNERPVSPIAPQSIETPFYSIRALAMVTERTYDSTEPLTEIISATNKEPSTEIISAINKQEDTHVVHNTPSSPVSSLISRVIEETHHLQTSASSPLSTLFENGADVEIATSVDATCRIWYPGNVFATNLCDGVEKVAVTLFTDQKRVTVTADKIRPKPPVDDREKKFEMMDNVEAFYSKGWSSGQVRMILGENTFSVYLNSSMETLEFKASDLRIHREWLDGLWKMADENEEPRVKTHFDVGANVEIASKDEDIYVKWYPGIVLKTDIRNGVGMLKVEYSTRFRDKEKKTKKLQESVSIHSIRPQPPPGDTKGFELMDKVEAYHNDGWCSGEVHIILSNDIYSVRFNSSTEFIKFNFSDLRIPKEWVDGVWKMEKEVNQMPKIHLD
ncbi:hypothetical protein Bca52824_048349 [Brassica carinata]|uniref:glucan endo-1,3-beta-D-glucosidase n=1 Tax=Brassica carinata TaxID=52824 RepID=A0A8X7RKZ6_BRACI|nr:hypothetical protein Bca52824_048349 [Brassica carinata]